MAGLHLFLTSRRTCQDMFCPSFPNTFSLFYFLIITINIFGSCSLGAKEKFH